jgi:DNA-directed RNA polymerase specialized sigma24 family protein
LDTDNTSDEVLLLLGREGRCRAAADALTRRYWYHAQDNLARRPMSDGLSSWDLEDARQQAYFWIQEAVRAFDFGQLARPRGSSFRTFVNGVFRRRLLDFRRALRRNRRRHQSVDPLKEVLEDNRRDNDGGDLSGHGDLRDALRRLDAPARALWSHLCRGKRLVDLPAVLAVSYRTLKRRWRVLREQLASTVTRKTS